MKEKASFFSPETLATRLAVIVCVFLVFLVLVCTELTRFNPLNNTALRCGGDGGVVHREFTVPCHGEAQCSRFRFLLHFYRLLLPSLLAVVVAVVVHCKLERFLN